MTIKRITALLLIFCIFTFNICIISAEPEETPTAEQAQPTAFPEPHAKAALLYDLNGGRIIYESNSTEKNYPASLTKIMTALLLLENGNLSDKVTVSESALADITYLHSKLGLKVGEEITVENLLISLLVSSANDSANVIAEYVSGDIPSFVALMNKRAEELGMTGTHYENPHGFHHDNHYSTAADIATVAREALKYDKLCEIVKIKTYDIPASNMSEVRKISSTNHLVSTWKVRDHFYPYATGLKTGSTTEAGSCLVATAEKNGVKLLSVVLGCQNENLKERAYSFVDTKAMFEYIFNNYKTVAIASKSDIIADHKVKEAKDGTRVALSPSEDIIVLLPKDYDEKSIKPEIVFNENSFSSPIEKGVKLGTAAYKFDKSEENLIAPSINVDLISANEVKRDNLLHSINSVGSFLSNPLVIIIVILILVIIIYVTYNKRKRRQQRRRRMKSQHLQSSGDRHTLQRKQNITQQNKFERRHTSSRSSHHKLHNSSRRSTSIPTKTPDPWDKYR